MKADARILRPIQLVAAAVNLAVEILSIGICAYLIWLILSDWPHFSFVRGVGLVFCILFGGSMLEMLIRLFIRARRRRL